MVKGVKEEADSVAVEDGVADYGNKFENSGASASR